MYKLENCIQHEDKLHIDLADSSNLTALWTISGGKNFLAWSMRRVPFARIVSKTHKRA